MIARYERTARTFSELDLGELGPLDEAVPELAIAHGLPTANATDPEGITMLVGHLGFEPRANGLRTQAREAPNPAEPLISAENAGTADRPGPAEIDARGHSVANQPGEDDPVEAALKVALRRAIDAEQWEVVAQLGAEVRARREARSAVVDLAAERAKRRGP